VPNVSVYQLPSVEQSNPRLRLLVRPLPTEGTVFTFSVSSVTAFANRVEVTFNVNVELFGAGLLASGWALSAVTVGAPVPSISSVAVAGQVVTLYTSGEFRTGASYNLDLPLVGIGDVDVVHYFTGPFTAALTGVGTAPTVVLAAADDGLHVRVVFSEQVVEAEALLAANYSIPGLTVSAVRKETNQVFVLTTSAQTPGTSYTVTVSGIHDLNGNLI